MVSPPAWMKVALPVMVVTPPELSLGQATTAMVGRTEENALEAPAVETAQPGPSPVPAATSVMGRTETGTSAEDVVTGRVPVPMSPTPAATRRTVLEEALLQEGSASPGVGVRPSQSLVQVGDEPHAWGGPRIRWAERQNPELTFFVLDDREEAKDWGTIQTGVVLVVRSLTTALDLLCDVVAPVDQV